MRYWLMKSEPGDCSIDDLAAMKDQTVAWYGVRNYQARNFMRDQMQVGDGVLFYHSNCKEPGIAGIAQVSSTAYPDATQFNKKSKYFDEKATQETPRWFNVDVKLVKKIALISIDELKQPSRTGEHAHPATRQSFVHHPARSGGVEVHHDQVGEQLMEWYCSLSGVGRSRRIPRRHVRRRRRHGAGARAADAVRCAALPR